MKFQKVVVVFCAVFLAVICTSFGAPAESTSSSLRSGSNEQSAFGQAFDEIVVESTLNVKRKADGTRQSRNNQAPSIRTKRQHRFPGIGASSADAQSAAHSFMSKNPLGNFGASASSGLSQSLAFGPNGPVSAAGFGGAQHYTLPNGQTFDVSFGNAAASTGSNTASGATLALSGPSK